MTGAPVSATCTTTGVRRASCACSACAHGAQPTDKLAANQRDVHALLSFLRRIALASGRGCAAPDWSDVAEWASWRAELLDLTLRILGEGARAELEGALDIPRGLDVVGLHPRGDR